MLLNQELPLSVIKVRRMQRPLKRLPYNWRIRNTLKFIWPWRFQAIYSRLLVVWINLWPVRSISRWYSIKYNRPYILRGSRIDRLRDGVSPVAAGFRHRTKSGVSLLAVAGRNDNRANRGSSLVRARRSLKPLIRGSGK